MTAFKNKIGLAEQLTVKVHHDQESTTEAAPRCSWPGCNNKVTAYLRGIPCCNAHIGSFIEQEMRSKIR